MDALDLDETKVQITTLESEVQRWRELLEISIDIGDIYLENNAIYVQILSDNPYLNTHLNLVMTNYQMMNLSPNILLVKVVDNKESVIYDKTTTTI